MNAADNRDVASNQNITAAKAHALAFLRECRLMSDKSASKKEQACFPYIQSGEASTEASAWALIALRQDEELALAGLSYLSAAQNKDGGWSTRPNAGKSDWTTGPALLAMRILHDSLELKNKQSQIDGTAKEALDKGMSYLLDSRVEFYGPLARLLLLMSKGPESVEYARGWPWDQKCFHWLEPTAYCLMALKLPAMPDKQEHRDVVKFADRFIFEHACQGGGWNHGNDLSLGVYLPAYRLTTAEALLALQVSALKSNAENDKKIAEALQFLEANSKEDSSSLSLAASILALHAHGKSCQAETNFLLARQSKNGAFGPTIMSTAMAALALEAAGGGEAVLRAKRVS